VDLKSDMLDAAQSHTALAESRGGVENRSNGFLATVFLATKWKPLKRFPIFPQARIRLKPGVNERFPAYQIERGEHLEHGLERGNWSEHLERGGQLLALSQFCLCGLKAVYRNLRMALQTLGRGVLHA
jgi:hypothetical protein